MMRTCKLTRADASCLIHESRGAPVSFEDAFADLGPRGQNHAYGPPHRDPLTHVDLHSRCE